MIKYISILPITLYLIWIVSTIGIQKSISQTYYEIKQKIWFWLSLNLTAWLFLIGYEIENYYDSKIWFLIVSVIGIGYTTAAARFKDDIVGTYHYIGALGAYISGYAFIVALHGWGSLWFIVPSLLLIGLAKYYYNKVDYTAYNFTFTYNYVSGEGKMTHKPKNTFVWWAEIIGLITIYLATIL
jgi:hypothetical protein